MSDVIISVEGLGKKYVLNHQGGERGGYRRFSESLEGWIKKPFAALAGGGKREVEGNLPPTSFHLPQPSHEEFWALKDVSFEVKRGEVVGIIGRNGAGKSTLLKILSRITEPSEGRVTLRGRVASLLEVGTGFHPELTGRENIYLNGAILGMTKAEIRKKFDEIVAFAEVERFLDTPVKRYSSGMYVRLAFAVAAHLEPEILVVDEVLAVGDAEFQKKCLGKMKDVATGGRTVLFVSHNMGAIKNLCRQALLLKNGHKEAFGPVDETIQMYLAIGKNESSFRPNLSKSCHIQEINAVSEGGGTGENFLTNETVIVRVKYHLQEKTRGARVGFSLVNQDGVPIFACSPEDEGVQTVEDSGSHVFEARIPPNTFLKGIYQIQAGLWNGLSGEIYDQPITGKTIQVEAAREKAYARDNFRPGSIQLRVEWKKA